MKKKGRILVRKSGTEPKIRIMAESDNKSLILRINDRGPYVVGRILDCSYGAAKKLGFVDKGTTEVKTEVIEWGDGEYMHHRKKRE